MDWGYSGKMSHLQTQRKARSDGVSAQVEAQGRQGLPGFCRGIPQRRQVQDEDGRVAGLPRRAGEAVRRPDRSLQGRLRRGQRRGEGRAPKRAGHDLPPAKDRQARGSTQKRRICCAAGRLQRPRYRDSRKEQNQGLQGLLRQQRRHEDADRRANHRPRLQEERLGEQRALLFQDCVLTRRHLPRP